MGLTVGFHTLKISERDVETLEPWENSEFEVYHTERVLGAIVRRNSGNILWLVQGAGLKMILHSKSWDPW